MSEPGVKVLKTIHIPTSERTTCEGTDNPFKSHKMTHMQEWAILDNLLPIILYHRKGCLVEIGVGVSTFFMCRHGYEYNRRVYSVDKNPQKLKKYGCTGIYDGHYPVFCKSEEFMEVFDEPCAAVLIDGAHEYDIAKKEFTFFYGKLVEGGVIFIHDTNPPVVDGDDPAALLHPIACGDVWRLRKEIEQNRDGMEVFTWPYTAQWMGLTMVLKNESSSTHWGV